MSSADSVSFHLYADVILPMKLGRTYTYAIPDHINGNLTPGIRVIVPFKGSRLYSAVLVKVHSNPPTEYQARFIDSIQDEYPVVTEIQFRFWEWMANYYLCTTGEVMNAALPGGMKLNSDKKVVLHPDWSEDLNKLNDQESLIVEGLQIRKVLSLEDVSSIAGIKNPMRIIKSLIQQGIVILEEELKEKVRPRYDDFVYLTDEFIDEGKLQAFVNQIASEKKKEKQLNILLKFLQLSGHFSPIKTKVVLRDLIKLSKVNRTHFDKLVLNGVFKLIREEVSRFPSETGNMQEVVLSETQQTTLNEIKNQFQSHNVVMLRGVTSSGKTEIYIKLMQQCLAKGKQVLFLLPEIAITVQIIRRLKRALGNRVGVYHSKYSEAEKVEVWNTLLRKKDNDNMQQFDVIVGVRSSVFLPFDNLGLVIIDEEHDSSYKQAEPSPRYHARDAAIYLSTLYDAKVLLGSATPSVESYYHATSGKFGLCEINERYGGAEFPEIKVIDSRYSRQIKGEKGNFTGLLIDEIEKRLASKEQVILFRNRRGYAPMLICGSCGWSKKCVNCDIHLTFHKQAGILRCHLCGYTEAPHNSCPACDSDDLNLSGSGTEKVEEELEIIFPESRISRMDSDTTKGKKGMQKIIEEFESNSTDILIGTQMVTKGLDFSNVSLVGILQADQILRYPDFRSNEKAFQLMMQVAGRAGRSGHKRDSLVIIQSTQPDHPVIRHVLQHNFKEFFEEEIKERENYGYPPFRRLIKFNFRHKDPVLTDEASALFVQHLILQFGHERVLGPEYPLISKINNYFYKSALLKLEKTYNTSESRHKIRNCMAVLLKDTVLKKVEVMVDADPT